MDIPIKLYSFALAKCNSGLVFEVSVPWMSGLVSGLQNRVRRFESARHLPLGSLSVPWMSGLVSGLQNRVRRFESARNLVRKGGFII